MATLTYDPTPADQPEFNEQEQEAIAIGEQAEAEQQQMLAGKFKDAEALEQAYIELQKKLGEPNEEVSEVQSEELQAQEEEEEVNPNFELLNKASEEFYSNNGEVSPEVLEELGKLDSNELINAYITMQGQKRQGNDLSDAQASEIKSLAGGEEGYSQLTQWAASTLDESTISAYDNIVETGDFKMIQLALAGLQAEYEKANGFEGQMLTGKPAKQQVDVFLSQAEVVEAMSDPRYDRDPAYRQDVFDKLNRSDIQY